MKTNTLPLRLRNGAINLSSDTITVGSQFDISSTRQFSRAIARLILRKPAHAIIDMSRTSRVDSSGFGALVSGLKKLSDNGAIPVLVSPNSSVRRLMDFAGLSRTFAIVDRVTEARRLLAAREADALAS